MTIRENLLYMMRINKQALWRLIDDISEEESMRRLDGRLNHIRWQTGHILYTNSIALSLLGDETEYFNNLKETFGGGSIISIEPSDYPPMSELRKRLYELYDKLIGAVESAADDDFARETGEGKEREPVWQTLAFFCMHDFYHAGQITQLRRMMGREKPFR